MRMGSWRLPPLNLPAVRARVWPVLVLAALMVMECTGISLWYQALFRPRGLPWLGIFAVLLAIFAASHLLLHLMEARHLRLLPRQGILLAWLIIVTFASLKLFLYAHTPIPLLDLIQMPVRFIIRSDVDGANFFHIIVLVLLVGRGVALARGPANLSAALGSFQLWLMLLLLYGMIYGTFFPEEAVIGLYLFLFSGLVALSSARIASLTAARGGRLPRFGLGWLASILLSALAVVGLAILLGWLASGRVVEVFSMILVILFAFLTAVALLILSPLLVYLADLLPKLADLLQQLLARLKNLQVSQQFQKLIEVINAGLGKAIPYVLAVRGLVLLGILIALVAGILLALYIRGRTADLVEEEDIDTIAPGAADNPLRKLLQRVIRGARSLRGRDPRQLLAAARIRLIYRQLMALSKKLGAERSPSVTPLEFVPRMAGVLPEEDAGLEKITEAYVKVRYGEYPESREEVEAVEEAWARVKKAGRKFRGISRASASESS